MIQWGEALRTWAYCKPTLRHSLLFLSICENPACHANISEWKLEEIQNTPIILLRFHLLLRNQYHNPPPPQSNPVIDMLLVVAHDVLWHESGVTWLSEPGLITDLTAFLQRGKQSAHLSAHYITVRVTLRFELTMSHGSWSKRISPFIIIPHVSFRTIQITELLLWSWAAFHAAVFHPQQFTDWIHECFEQFKFTLITPFSLFDQSTQESEQAH